MYQFSRMGWRLLPLLLIFLLSACYKETSAKLPKPTDTVTLTDNGSTILLKNSQISVTINKGNAEITSILPAGSSNLLMGGEVGYYLLNYSLNGKDLAWGPGKSDLTYKLVSSSPNQAEISLSINDPKKIPFALDFHFVLRAGDSGIYFYDLVQYPQGMPDKAEIAQARYAIRVNPEVFKSYEVDDTRKGLLPTPAEVKNGQPVTDATFKLSNGEIYTKYQAINYEGENHVYGLYGDHIGISLIQPNTEALTGGPTKQELTVHQTDTGPILLFHEQTDHYGTPNLAPPKGWQKIYGPVFIYVNQAAGLDQLWADARARADAELRKWPYSWVKYPEYAAEDRGSVAGQLSIADGSSPNNAWVILAAPQPDWQLQNLGYEYYVRADAKGNFSIPAVRPGTYTLYAIVEGVAGEYRQDGITVSAGQTTNVGLQVWKPETFGTKLWQIGIPNRSASEFRHGDEYHQFGLWLDYPTEFPNDVDFYVGKSNERTDWNYVQPVVKTPGELDQLKVKPDLRLTQWKIHFDQSQPLSGKATLLIGIASSRNGSLKIELNGTELASYSSLPGPSNDSAMPRVAVQGIYRELQIHFDASLIKQGSNLITLTPVKNSYDAQGKRIGDVYSSAMYDFLRLDVAQSQ